MIPKNTPVEKVICLSVLLAMKIKGVTDLEDSDNYYESLDDGCNTCPYANDCLACIINQ